MGNSDDYRGRPYPLSVSIDKTRVIVTPLDRRRVYIVPTRYGVMLSVLLFAILLGSINYDNALGYILTFLLSGLYLVGLLHTYRNLTGLSASRIASAPAFAGDFMRFVIKLDNPSPNFRILLNLSVREKKTHFFSKKKIIADCEVPRISARETLHPCLAVRATTRGRYELPRVRISSTFPLGIFVAWGFFPNTEECLVYPKPVGQMALPQPTLISSSQQLSSGSGDEDFRGLRQYSPGEPVKRIAWKALAKTDELMSKQFSGDGDTQLILDWRHTATLGDPEKRLSQLCMWVVTASRMQSAFGMNLPKQVIEVGSGETHRRRCLRALAEY